MLLDDAHLITQIRERERLLNEIYFNIEKNNLEEAKKIISYLMKSENLKLKK